MSYYVRYREALDEARWADEMGFDVFGFSEQHFVQSGYTVSAPEVFLGAVAVCTKHIRLRNLAVVMLRFNHAVRIAERLATLDLLSRGRMEIGTARSNNFSYMKALGVDPTQTREEWRETLEVVVRALVEPQLEFHGKFYDIDPISVVPRMYQTECPPIFVSATSTPTHQTAGELGIGAMTFENWFGWDYLEECIRIYQSALRNAKPIGGLWRVNPTQSLLSFPSHCAATRKQAIEEARTTIVGLLEAVSHQYAALASHGGGDYAYLARIRELGERKADIDYLYDTSPALIVGTPDEVIERLKKLEKMGIDEIILKIDGGYGHQAVMRGLEMFGKYVIPEFRNPRAIPPNDFELLGVEGIKPWLL
jgi:alkanesulfonate monooxygenase SsuD/methylene tetrahydromethanopterin reductase-like flavin-dependent oxidoreductase (luciferase family)